MGEWTPVLIIVYLILALLWAMGSWDLWRDSEDSRMGARGLLATPIWPLVALWLLLRYGLPALGRGLGHLVLDATRSETDDG